MGSRRCIRFLDQLGRPRAVCRACRFTPPHALLQSSCSQLPTYSCTPSKFMQPAAYVLMHSFKIHAASCLRPHALLQSSCSQLPTSSCTPSNFMQPAAYVLMDGTHVHQQHTEPCCAATTRYGRTIRRMAEAEAFMLGKRCWAQLGNVLGSLQIFIPTSNLSLTQATTPKPTAQPHTAISNQRPL
eukprot:354798-Chlamydomonas_euryale.AAC.4